MYPEENDSIEERSKGSDLLPRIISGAIMIPAALAAVYFGGYVWMGLIVVLAALLALEWAAMVSDADTLRSHQVIVAGAVLIAIVISFIVGTVFGLAFATTFGVVYMTLGAATMSKGRFWAGFGIVYIGVASITLYWLRLQSVPSGLILLVFLFLSVWGTDIGAYFVGRSVGGPKIFPAISPNKTWSGSIGGVVVAAGLACLMKPAFGLNGAYIGLAVAGIGMSCVAQAGDAFESALKRFFGIKDSGTIIPGHGGVLDRLDALLLAAPVMAAFIHLSQ